MDFSTFPKYKPELFDALDEVLAHDIPEVMNMLPKPQQDDEEENAQAENPFAEVELEKGVATWRITQAHKSECDNVFATLKQNNGKASGSAVKAVLMKSDLEMNDLRKIWELADPVVSPAYTAGLSLGEYSALQCAGVLDAPTAISLVAFRGKAMAEAVVGRPCGMAAVLNLDRDALKKACEEASDLGVVECTNFNCPGQVVIAGHKEGIEKACAAAQQKGARRALILPVSAPFHSSLLAGAAKELSLELARVEVHAPAIEVIANVDVACHKTPDGIREILALQAARPVQWVKTIEKMRDEGVTHIVECGPGKVLTGMIRRIAPDIKTLNIFDADSLAAVKSEIEAAAGAS